MTESRIPDPKIIAGPFKVYDRTDGLSVVVDRRRPWNDRRVAGPFPSLEAEATCVELGAREGFKRGEEWDEA